MNALSFFAPAFQAYKEMHENKGLHNNIILFKWIDFVKNYIFISSRI